MSINKTTFLAFIYLPLALFLSACGGGSSDDSNDLPLVPGTLISSSFIGTNSSILQRYAVDSYEIIYSTVDTDNNQINASGLLSIPQKSQGEKSPLLSYQHGTIFTDSGAPSNNSGTIQGIAILAGDGYIVSSPDYLGYAESTSIIHPYVHAESLATASIDMLRASKAFLANRNIETNDQLFLAGYSEGGYATIALQKAIKENYANEFTVSASAAGAGPYDLSESARFFANQTVNNSPSFMSFVVKAYDSVYSLNLIDEMYQEPFRDYINSAFDGSQSGSQINAALPSVTADLFEPDFLSLLQGGGSHPLKDVLALNDIYDWTPTAPTRLYHSFNDEIVPYENSRTAFDTMVANGSTSVSLEICPLSGHAACAVPYVLDALAFLNDIATDL